MDSLNLSVTNSVAEGKSRRTTRLATGSSDAEIFYEFDRLIPFSGETVLDGHVLAVLLYAMMNGRSLVVHGPLSRQFMRNVEELQLVWSRWRPEKYKKIEIIPDRIISSFKPLPENTLAAFSGGVDAIFTALRNAHSENPARYPVTAALMVHGFDVKVADHKGFERLVARVRPLLDDLKLDLRLVRTNSRDFGAQDWEDVHALQLAACLHMFSDEFGHGLIGSSDWYDELTLPWGSNPITDPLTSGSNFAVVHDGAGYSRTEKVAEIKDNLIACTNLNVCWAGGESGKNCGRCNKCILTRLNFLAAGAPSAPPCFPGELELNDVKNLAVRDAGELSDLDSIIVYATQHQVSGPWLAVLKSSVRKYRRASEAKASAKYVLKSIGLYEPAKRLYLRIRRSS
jgi:hypothetical protein